MRVALLFAFLCLFLSSSYCQRPRRRAGGGGQTCPRANEILGQNVDATGKWRVFNQLSEDELRSVVDFCVDQLGLYHIFRSDIAAEVTTDGPNVLSRVELMEPVKAEVLDYLDNGGPTPSRFAKVTVIRSEAVPKDVMEYKVGPLPLAIGAAKAASSVGANGDESPVEGVVVQKLRDDGEIPFHKRPAEAATASWHRPVLIKAAYTLRKLFKDAVGWCYGYDDATTETRQQTEAECGQERIEYFVFPALDANTSKRVMHSQWFFKPFPGGADEMHLHSIPISFKLEEGLGDPDQWRTFDFEYCHQGPFESPEVLVAAYESGTLVKCIAEDWKDKDYDAIWSRTDGRTRTRAGSDTAGPRTFYPEGQRFFAAVDEPNSGSGFKFEHMGWEGHVSMRYATGIALHDIRFRGNRIVYELALQEQFVAYSGYAGGGQTIYMDSFFGIGLNVLPLRRGIDCPETAQYFAMTKYSLSGRISNSSDIFCIFEEDAQEPEWRHTHINGTAGSPHVDAVRRSNFVVRTVATVGNYDYLYSIRFRPDASISVETTLAGYMLSNFFDTNGQTEKEIPFGTRVHKHTLATLHDHLSGWKVDLDVLGTKNSVQRQSVKVGTWEEALASAQLEGTEPPPWHSGSVVKYVERRQVGSEFGFLIRDPGTVVHTFTNEAFTNSWGQPRGYAVVHGMTSRQLLPATHPFTKAAAWSKYHLAVAQRKEKETFSHAACYDMVAPADPITSLDDYLDGESIVNEDLVAWVMMGLIHVPRSEDVPLISNMGSQFFIKPWNYYDELVSMDAATEEDFATCSPLTGNAYRYSWSI